MICEKSKAFFSVSSTNNDVCILFFRADFPAYSFKSFKVYIKTLDFKKILIKPIKINVDVNKDEYTKLNAPIGEGYLEVNLAKQLYKYHECKEHNCLHVHDFEIYYK